MLQLPDYEHSFWRTAYPEALYPALQADLEVEVAIVGGGISGLTAAYLLKQAGLKVAVIEKDTVGGGTSGRTTGKVTSQHNLIYADLQQRLGGETARLYGEANQAAVKQVQTIITAEKIDCDWRREDNYVYTTDIARVKSFREEAHVAAELGLPASFETASPLPFAIRAAVKFSGQGTFHSQRYLLGLAAAVNGHGSYVFEHSNATGIRDGSPGRVRTSRAAVHAKHIIVATNVPTLPLAARGAYCLLEYPQESYIVAGRYTKRLRGMYISPDSGQYSILPVRSGNDRLLLIGGNGHLSGLRLSKEHHWQQLADYAEQHFGITEIVYKWSDRDYMAYDGLPLVGRLYPWSKNLYVASAYRKWGLSNGTAAGMILRDLITGQPNAWATVFTPQRTSAVRSIPHAVGEYISSHF